MYSGEKRKQRKSCWISGKEYKMVNKRLKKLIIEAVENQMRDPETKYVKETYEKMNGAGYTAKEAKEAIAGVLLSEMYTIMGEQKPFDESRYRKGLEEMLEDYEIIEVQEPWTGMGELLEQGGDALDQDFRDPSAITPWEKAWEIVKEKVKNADMAMEIFEVDEATDYEYDLAEWIESMMFSYQRMEAYEKCICFCKEVLETFAWKNSSPAMFKRCIGECLFTLGKTDESDQWHEEWLESEWEPAAAIAAAFYWMERKNYGKAEQILDRILKECEGTTEYDGFYRSAAAFYRLMGEEKKAKEFDRIEEEYAERLKEMEDDFEDWELPFLSEADLKDPRSRMWNMDAEREHQETVVKPKKIYPNDPCPCGSGKKYKKCCGR